MTNQPHHRSDGLTTPDYVQSPGLVAAFLEQLPLGVGLLDCEGRWLLTNAALRSFVGDVLPSRDPEQMRRWRAWDQHGNAIGPQEWPSARALRGEMVCDGLEMLYQPPGRPPVWTRVRSTPLRNQNGDLMGAITTVEDIDQRKRAEEALRDNERRLQQANDYLELAQIAGSVGFFNYSPEHDCCLWTEGMSRLYGIAPEEYDGTWRGWAMRVVAEDAESTRRAAEAAIRVGAEQVTHEFRVVLPDGTVRWLAMRGRIYYGAHGKPLRVIGVNIDITDQKKRRKSASRARNDCGWQRRLPDSASMIPTRSAGPRSGRRTSGRCSGCRRRGRWRWSGWWLVSIRATGTGCAPHTRRSWRDATPTGGSSSSRRPAPTAGCAGSRTPAGLSRPSGTA